MYKILTGLFFFCLISSQCHAQIFPKEGSKLNYRIIGFTFPQSKQGSTYTIEIASGTYYSEDSFKNNIITSYTGDANRIIEEVPSFGKQYTWRIITSIKAKNTQSQLYHFSTAIIPAVDTNVMRLKVIKTAEKYKDAFIFLDNTGVLYDMSGQPVWYLPANKEYGDVNLGVFDIKFSPQETITFMSREDGIFEVNYNGDILWKGPNNGKVSGDSIEHYHHEFTRLTNGCYMVLGLETGLWELPSFDSNLKKQAGLDIKQVGNEFYQPITMGTIIEYNEKGTVVWSWKSSDYFKSSDIYFKRNAYGLFDFGDVHENSFFFDENSKTIYLSCRNISRVLKIKYPEGKVLNDYGERYSPGVPETENALFCNQHSCKYSQQGYLYLFNNNACATGKMPTVEKLQESAHDKYGLKKIWEYECTVEDVNDEKASINTQEAKEIHFLKGGNVIELPDLAMFVSMAGMFPKIFIVSPDKEILWSALSEKWDSTEKKWGLPYQYRANIIPSRKEMERLIWNGEEWPLPAYPKER